MKNRKVLNLRTHIAGVLSKTSYDHEKHMADMQLEYAGVLVKSIYMNSAIGQKEVNVLIPFGNIIEAVLAPEETKEQPIELTTAQEQPIEKRRGRQPMKKEEI